MFGQYSGSASIPVFTSTDPSGAITVRFTSDGSVNNSGFQLNYNCVSPCSGMPVPGNTLSSSSQACPGVNFNLSLENPSLTSGITYQWQSSTNGTVYSNIAGAVYNTCVINQSVPTYYRCLVSCSNSSLSAYSNPLFVSMNSICYCIPTTNNINSIDIITKVSLTNSINNSVSQSSSYNSINSYDLYYSPVLDFQRGTNTNKLTVSFGNDGNQWSAAWIDFNQNGIFESTENIALAPTSSGSGATVSYTFTVPITANLGQTRLRVRGGSDNTYTSSDACTTTSYGETEDYIVNILPVYTLGISGPSASCSSTNVQYVIGSHNFPGTPTYQWYYNSIPLGASGSANAPYYSSYSGGTSETLDVNTGTSSPINWSCVATYNGWPATSNTISLSITGSPSVAPTGITVLNNNTCNSTSKTLTVTGGSIGTAAAWRWYVGSCGGAFVGTGASIVVNPATTTTYYVRAEGACNVTNCASVVVDVISAPSNDDCVNAVSIAALPFNSGARSTNCATNDSPPVGASSCGNHDNNVWFKFIGTGNQININTCDAATNFDTEIHVYIGNCGSMTEIGCNDDGFDIGCGSGKSSYTFCSTIGVTYFVSVGSYQLGGATGNFSLNVSEQSITDATITSNYVCGNGPVTLLAMVGANADAVDFSLDGGITIATSDLISPFQYTTSLLTAPQAVQINVRSRNTLTGCVSSWTNFATANAFQLPSLTTQALCNFENMSRVELIASGGSGSYSEYQQVSPFLSQPSNRFSLPYSSTRSYRVKDSYGCYSPIVNHTSEGIPTQISGTATSGSCLIRGENSWWHITDPSNNVILSINDNNNDLGSITAWSYVEPTTTFYNETYYLKRHFKVTAQNTPSTNVTLRLYFRDDEFSELVTNSTLNSNSADDVFSLSDLKVTRYSGPNEDNSYSNNDFLCGSCFSLYTPSTGTPISPNLGSDVRYVEISVPGFSEQWIHGGKSNSSILPVELISFNASCVNDKTLLRWVTATETNNSHFIIEKSVNGIDFNEISRINGSGNSNDYIEYSFVDEVKSSKLVYYRLKQVDYDGTIETFNVISSSCLSNESTLSIYPNPFKDKVLISNLKRGNYVFEVINSYGQKVLLLNYKDVESVDLNTSNFSAGVYKVKIINEIGESQLISVVKN